MSDLQVVVQFCLQGLLFHCLLTGDVPSLTDLLALVKHRPEYNVCVKTIFAMVLKNTGLTHSELQEERG